MSRDTILEANAAVEEVRGLRGHAAGVRPKSDWLRGECPQCGEELVSNCYYVGGRGYLVTWDCWASLSEEPTCDYRKVI